MNERMKKQLEIEYRFKTTLAFVIKRLLILKIIIKNYFSFMVFV